MTRLLVNATTLNNKPTGLGVYSNNCISEISKRLDVDYISTDTTSRFIAPNGLEIGTGRTGAIKRAIWLNTRAIDSGFLLYSPTHHGCWRAKRQIITIHDLIAIHHPNQHPNQHRYFRYFLPLLIRKCEAVFTVSETTKSDICNYYGYPSERIHVVPNGIDASLFTQDTIETLPSPYLLIVGANYPHKNVEEVLRLNDLWRDRYRLVIASCAGDELARLTAIVNELNLSQYVSFTGYLSQTDLIHLYKGASALIYPSQIEGFGIPPLEALACGTPVIASNIPVLREVLGESAFFFTIGNIDSWTQALSDISDSEKIQNINCFRQATLQKWSWEASGGKLIQALLSVEPSISGQCNE